MVDLSQDKQTIQAKSSDLSTKDEPSLTPPPKSPFQKSEETSPIKERIGFLDIETTGLNANWDYVISYAIKDGDNFFGRTLTRRETLNWELLDKNLMREFCEDVKKFDRLIVYWGKDRRHDVPFLRTRSLKWNLRFPFYKEVLLIDCYDMARGKLRLHRYRLENVAQFLSIPAKDHRLDADIWQKAKLGHRPSLNYVWEHNKEYVVTLEKVYNRLIEFYRKTRSSI